MNNANRSEWQRVEDVRMCLRELSRKELSLAS